MMIVSLQGGNLMLAIMLLALCAGCSSPAPAPPPAALLGDSIIAQIGSVPGFVNLAVSGYTVPQIQTEIAKVPRAVTTFVLDGGSNDLVGLAHTPQQVGADYDALLAAFPPAAKIFLLGVPPVDESMMKAGFAKYLNHELIAETNAKIKAACAERSGCTFIGTPFGSSMTSTETIDGIHPTAETRAALTAFIEVKARTTPTP